MVNKKKTVGKLQEVNDCSLPLFSIDDYLENAPAAGYRYGSSLNAAGECGYCWGSTPDESYGNDAYGLYFNGEYLNLDWYDRSYGQSVRPVSE